MIEAVSDPTPKFGAENIMRIYRGEPVLVDEKPLAEILDAAQFETASYAADGLTNNEIAEEMDVELRTVPYRLQGAYKKLGISTKQELPAYFPMELGHGLVEDKMLRDLSEYPFRLALLEALSRGLTYKQIAYRRGITESTSRSHMAQIGEVWTDSKGALTSTRVANGIRAQYVRAIEAHSAPMEPSDIGKLTLPALAQIEPRIISRFIES